MEILLEFLHRSRQSKQDELNEVLFGASMTQYSFELSGWGAALQDLYQRKADILLRGYSGWNTRRALAVLEQLFPKDLPTQPALVTVFFGANDAAIPVPSGKGQAVPIEEFKANLVKIASYLKELSETTRVILITAPPIHDEDRINHQSLKYGEKAREYPDRTNERAGQYAAACIAAASEAGVGVVDLWTSIQQSGVNWSSCQTATILPLIDNFLSSSWNDVRITWRLPYFKNADILFTKSQIIAGIPGTFFCIWYVLKKHWLANNTLGLAFSIQGIEMPSLGSFKIGAILLAGLFFYDIFWVFFTPVMVSVAKSFDAPIKVPTTMTTFPSTAEVIPEPLGVALIISAWNYPLLLALVPVVGAIAGGNVVVLKPSELSPATSALLAKLFPLYLDPMAVRVVEGGIQETTSLLEQRWDKIFFTGSTRVGKIILAAAAKHLTPVTLELGGKSPGIVDSTVDMELVGRRVAWGKWAANNGQACIAPDYLLVEESVVPQLNVKNFYGEDPSTSSDITRVVNMNQFNRLSGLLDDKATVDKITLGGDRQ